MMADFEKGTKVCSKCKRKLPITEFYKNKSQKDGLHCCCKDCKIEWTHKYRKTQKGREAHKKNNDKTINTFGRIGRKRGESGMLKRDYELTEEQLQRRNNIRTQKRVNKNKTENTQGVLIWYSGLLDDLTSKEYRKIMIKEYNRQRCCAIRGYIGRTKPSEHFLFDFDLEQMLKDKVYYDSSYKIHIHKWWKGEIRHWTVNDGVWKDGK